MSKKRNNKVKNNKIFMKSAISTKIAFYVCFMKIKVDVISKLLDIEVSVSLENSFFENSIFFHIINSKTIT